MKVVCRERSRGRWGGFELETRVILWFEPSTHRHHPVCGSGMEEEVQVVEMLLLVKLQVVAAGGKWWR
ncbi:hypothetical protein HanXRQr2_Chr12g0534001 [Helianthus annuus]|uniref:Uncharacterized protein n=1 Tax=Helianthus annuus TaxID=4232 RepID=A0A9K3HFD1_HELAN|nr:hypothetical protein HanXRQr2_Chr12g0534001 [Helianthus annuus]KAJ0488859.1 hypothetical protein HanHA300_Chr12g0437551 [Helianthus annuus]KAJ0492451.1 hypothetical protein HanIR_Chr12g0575081 [Helianthus annuus]KAJ0504698.1 hypothetical protein HanHA89_Chr12g0462201 [Helianthus annuus]KAJ0674431.1 hypothetical protein HanLR1_Chr12g0439891 [Helianthus annuus]